METGYSAAACRLQKNDFLSSLTPDLLFCNFSFNEAIYLFHPSCHISVRRVIDIPWVPVHTTETAACTTTALAPAPDRVLLQIAGTARLAVYAPPYMVAMIF